MRSTNMPAQRLAAALTSSRLYKTAPIYRADDLLSHRLPLPGSWCAWREPGQGDIGEDTDPRSLHRAGVLQPLQYGLPTVYGRTERAPGCSGLECRAPIA